MAIQDEILSIVASEQGFLASILSAEAVKASATAAWVTNIDISTLVSTETPNQVISKAINMECVIAHVIDAAADKEIAIAAKVGAVNGLPVNIVWAPKGGCTSNSTCTC